MNGITPARLLLATLVLVLLTACGTAAATTTGASSVPGAGASGSAFSGKSVNGVPILATVPQDAAARPAPASVVPPIGEGPKVIRTAQVAVEVKNGTFDSTVDKIIGIASGLGGYIAGSNASADSGALRTGSVTFEIPSDKFTDAVSQVRGLGTVQNLVIGGQDVSAQYVDLQARLKNEQAQRDAMVALLSQARTVGDIIAIQNQLGNITGQIEELEGQINYYDHQTSFSTVSVSVHEAAVAFRPQVDSWGFVTALGQGLHGFVTTLDYLLVGVGYAGPILVLLGLGGIAWRLRRRFGLGGLGDQATL